MSIRLYFAGFILAGSGIIYTVNLIDRSANYQTVPAQIVSIKTSCFLEKRGFRHREWTETRPCDQMEDAQAEDDQYKDFTIQRDTTVEVGYFSPVDRAEHHGTLTDRSSGASEGFGGKHEGDQIEILAHTSDADKIQKL